MNKKIRQIGMVLLALVAVILIVTNFKIQSRSSHEKEMESLAALSGTQKVTDLQKETSKELSEASEKVTQADDKTVVSLPEDISQTGDSKENNPEGASQNHEAEQVQNIENAGGSKQESDNEEKADTSEKGETERQPLEEQNIPDTVQEAQQGTVQNQTDTALNQNSTEKKEYCIIEIRCDELSAKKDSIENEGLKAYIPEDGIILAAVQIEITGGMTVYDILKAADAAYGLMVTASYSPIYKTYYVESIHQIAERSAGTYSGWKYMVNGTVPNYGASSYEVKDGDSISWYYAMTY